MSMTKLTISIALTVLIGASLFGCTDDGGTRLQNQPPTVWLSAAPPEGTVSRYTLQLFWGGWDPDGQVRYYEYSITDNETGVFDPADTTGADKWHRVYRNDSTFTFTADVVADSSEVDPKTLKPYEFVRSHTFFIRAVDDMGLASPKPAYRSFTARTLSPTVNIVIPTSTGFDAASVPPISTFLWRGEDYVSNVQEKQEPDSVRHILVSTRPFGGSWDATLEYIRTNPAAPEWSKWKYYRAAADSGKFWTTPALPIGSPGNPSLYLFAVQVKDEAGAVSPVFDENRNVRRISVSPRTTGPLLSLYNSYIGTLNTASPDTPPVIIDMPSNVEMCFRFNANAKSYGGVASGYRYGWDIQDLTDPTQWAIDYTPFTRECRVGTTTLPCAEAPCKAWQFDTHTFYVEVIDNSGYTSRIAVTVNVIPFSMAKNVLIVDDWKEPFQSWIASGGAGPSDEEHDAFWLDMISEVADFDPAVDVFQIETELPLTTLSPYKSVIWVAAAAYNGTTKSYINEVIRFVDPTAPASTGKTTPNSVSLFMSAGGHVLLVGEQILTASINRKTFAPNGPVFPLIFRYELGADQDNQDPIFEDAVVGDYGVGEDSFGYRECCANVLDIGYIGAPNGVRRPINVCPVHIIRRAPQSGRNDGLRVCLPMDAKYTFPTLNLRPEVAGPGSWYSEDRTGLNCDIYNPPYFGTVAIGGGRPGTCELYVEYDPPRACFKPIYGNGCLNTASKIYNAPVAFWTTVYENRVPDAGGPAARSAVFGFHLAYFNPDEAQEAMNLILFDEWKLPRKSP
jgi:hypothetical protein